MKNTNWIWLPDWNAMDCDKPQIVYFRREINLDKVPEKLEIQISADSRYKLYVNGQLAEYGPSKGDCNIWYYDTVNLSPYLVTGRNALAVVVLRYPLERNKGNSSIFRTDTPGMYLRGRYKASTGETIDFSADETWRCTRDACVQIIPNNPALDPLYFMEHASGDPQMNGWKQSDRQ